jgi:rhodanese-related sulfurtransferase
MSLLRLSHLARASLSSSLNTPSTLSTSASYTTRMAPKYISAEELATIIRDPAKKPWSDYLVVDVRDDDYAGGNIPGAVNIPSRDYHMKVNDLIKEAHEKDVKLLVFHCSLSQQRGPKAARIYEEMRSNLYPLAKEAQPGDPKEVAILRDGFTSFQAKFKDDPKLVENWDKEVWNENLYH